MTTERGGTKNVGERAAVTLFTVIDLERHAALRAIASVQNKSLTDLVSDVLNAFVAEHSPRSLKERQDSENYS